MVKKSQPHIFHDFDGIGFSVKIGFPPADSLVCDNFPRRKTIPD